MKKIMIATSVLVLSLSACSTATKQKLGLLKQGPDEFMVSSRAPLSLPPEYNLRPVEGMENTSTVDMTDKLEGMSEGEQRLLSNVNAQNTDDDIKSKIDNELNVLKAK
jgi:hypothetical protein